MKNQAEIWLMKCMLAGRKPPAMEAGFYLRCASAPVEHVVLAGDLARNLRRRASRRLSRLAYCAPQEKARRVETAGF